MNAGRSIYETAGNFCTSDNGKKGGKRKKRGFQPEKSGGSPASTHKKPLICPFWEKASMENHFGFCALKSPQTRMNTDKNGVDI